MANEDAVTDALAAAVAADAALDALVDAVNLAINGAKKPSASNPLQKLYFGSTAPSKFKQPILGSELKDMEQWPALLDQSTVPALKALAAQATTAVQNGTAAATAVSAAIAAREAWNSGGPRKALFDAFNALCATAYGGLKAFALANPNLSLATNYAETFFQHTAPSPYGKTVNEASAKLASRAEEGDHRAEAPRRARGEGGDEGGGARRRRRRRRPRSRRRRPPRRRRRRRRRRRQRRRARRCGSREHLTRRSLVRLECTCSIIRTRGLHPTFWDCLWQWSRALLHALAQR